MNRMNRTNYQPRRRPAAAAETTAAAAAAAGFTLIELMVSIALVLIIVLGVNQVFSITSRTVGAGQALSTAVRDNRSLQYTFFSDLKSAVTHDRAVPTSTASALPPLPYRAPFFIIESQPSSAFLDAADEQSDRDYLRSDTSEVTVDRKIRTFDRNGNDDELDPEDIALLAIPDGRRVFRQDTLSFFARGLYRRKTGNSGVYSADMTSNEAWIVYNHLKQPNKDMQLPDARNPGWRPVSGNPETVATNPNNFYARQWILGRTLHLLKAPSADGELFDLYGNEQRFIQRKTAPNDTSMSPLSNRNSQVDKPEDGITWLVQYNRYDLIGTSIDKFKADLANYYFDPSNQPASLRWYEDLSYRFAGFPFPDRPVTSAGMARTVPCFLSGCTSFTVEYAGDFLMQHRRDCHSDDNQRTHEQGDGDVDARDRNHPNYAKVIAAVPNVDREIDFYLDGGVEKIRWYGYPRDTNGDGVVIGYDPGNPEMLRDVVPYRDVARTAPANGNYNGAPFERDLAPGAPGGSKLPARVNYTTPNTTGLEQQHRYICAWGPDTQAAGWPMPKLIRITLTLDDPTGRMTTGQTYEYIIELP
jgi:prepilin-type N-terminal cleavage/methylation domain-containing protein